MPSFAVLGVALLAGALWLLLWPLRAGRREAGGLRPMLEEASRALANLERGEGDLGSYASQRRAADAAVHDALLAQSKQATERKIAAWAVAAVVAGSVVGQALLGHPAPAPAALEATAQAPAHSVEDAQLQDLANRLAARLAQGTDDVQGWAMLARTYAALGRFDQATAAYARAATGPTPDASLLADYADALAASNGGRFNETARRVVAQALKANPGETKALSLAGTIAYDDGDYRLATTHWTTLLKLLPEGSAQRQGIERSLADAAAAAGQPPSGASAPDLASAGVADAAAPVLSGVVSIGSRLTVKAGPTDTLFVFAHAAGTAGGAPLAARRMAAVFPAAFSLSDAESMLGTRLSQAGLVTLSARLSRDGQATPKSGDPVGRLEQVKIGSKDLRLVIDAVVP
ncbi:MAG TPA: hypothetical protein VNU71_15120 [Burkholderiaceae bacterium]|nr:hypothetical protein [Burkholderiaceae bacterium]